MAIQPPYHPKVLPLPKDMHVCMSDMHVCMSGLRQGFPLENGLRQSYLTRLARTARGGLFALRVTLLLSRCSLLFVIYWYSHV